MAPYAIKLSVEVSAVLRTGWTKHCPMLSECDLLVTFHWRWVYLNGVHSDNSAWYQRYACNTK